MWDIFRFIAGLGVIIGLVAFYAWVQTFLKFKAAKEKEIRKDLIEFGACCGMESGVCTYQPKLDKLNKIDLNKNAAKKEK